MTRLFDASALAPIEREVVVMTIATRNDCELCVAMHTTILRRLRADADVV
ncbi:carboxymuconolactone decarboxylase family protein, partial [Stackebrandtia soli]